MLKKAVLIHGWDPNFYNTSLDKNPPRDIAWKNRHRLISLLKENYKLHFFNLPGFCNTPEPTNKNYYDVEDFANEFYLWIKKQNIKPDLLIGYSFGGAVLLNYLANHRTGAKAILISPALSRTSSSKSETATKLKKLVPKKYIQKTKSVYQFIFSTYYRKGSSFIRKSYDIIARREITSDLNKINPKSILLIYGLKDETTPWNNVKEQVIKLGMSHHLIQSGSHNIGQTHPEEIVKAINNFVSNK